MRFLDDREFPTTQDALLFYAAFVLAWAVFLPPVFWVCVELARALCLCCKYIAFAFAAMFPAWCVMAYVNAKKLRESVPLGVRRKTVGEADPLQGRSNGAKRLCIVGAGAAGLCATRAALRRGFKVCTYEKSDSPGGVWAYGRRSGKVFNSVLQNVTKMANCFADYPAPRSFPAYIGWRKTMEYLCGYAAAFQLTSVIELNAEVISVEKCANGEFEVTIASGTPRKDSNLSHRVERFDFVWVASGQLTKPETPVVRGLDSFTGDVMHSSEYTEPTSFLNRHVLVVGLGAASGSDIAQDLSTTAASVTLSIRTERYVMSRGLKHGMATFLNWISLFTPAWLGVVGYTYFDWWPCVHRIAPGVTDSGDLLKEFALQRIKRATLVDRIQGREVFFVDGTSGKFDAIIFATGYRREFNFMAENLRPTSGLFEHCVLPTEPRVGYILFVLPFGTHWQVAELQANYLARVHDGTIPLPSIETMSALAERFQTSSHHEHFAEYFRMKYLFLLAPYIFPKLETLLRQPRLMMRILWSPYVAPPCEWASESWRDRTAYGDARGHMSVKWNKFRWNRW